MAPDDWQARRARSCGIPDTDQTGRAPRDERQREMTRQFREIARRQLSYHLQRRRDRHLRQGWGGPPYVPAGYVPAGYVPAGAAASAEPPTDG
jgi:hypothetical protein